MNYKVPFCVFFSIPLLLHLCYGQNNAVAKQINSMGSVQMAKFCGILQNV